MSKPLIKILIFACVLISLTQCRFLTIDGDGNPPDDFNFIYQASISGQQYIWNANLYNRYAYCGDGNAVSVIDVWDSYAPTRVSTVTLPIGGHIVRKVLTDGQDNLIVAAGVGGLFILNTSNPAYPYITAEYPNIVAYDIANIDGYIAVINNNGWSLYYMAFPSHLTEVSTYQYTFNIQPQKLLLKENWVYVASPNRLDIFDITNTRITHERTVNIAGDPFKDFDIISNFIAFATNSTLYFIDIATPLTASIITNYSFASSLSPRTIRAFNDKIFIGWENRYLSAFKVSSIYSVPNEEARIEMNAVVTDIDFSGDILYISNNRLDIYRYF